MTCEIRLIGTPLITGADGRSRPVRGLQPWAVLARVLLSERPLTRRELSADLFPEANDPLGALRWCLAALRGAIGSSESLTGDPVRADLPPETTVDVWELADRNRFDVDQIGLFLEGVDPRCGPEFDTWLLVQRERVAGLIDDWLRNEVVSALTSGHPASAIQLAELSARRSPLDERPQVLLVKSLAAAGRFEAAAKHVEDTHALFRRELGVEPSAALRNAARRHVADAPAGVSRHAITASLLESGSAAINAGAVDAGLDCLRRACQEAELLDGLLHARCLLELGSALVHAVRSHDDEAALLLDQAADLAELGGDGTLAATAWQELGYIDALAGRRPSAARYLERAVAAAGERPQLLAGIRSIVAFNLADWGRLAESLHAYDESLELARSASDQRRVAWILGLGGWAHLKAGNPAAAKEWLAACLADCEQLGWVAFRPWPQMVLAELALGEPGLGLADHAHSAASMVSIEGIFALSCQLGDPCWEGMAARLLARRASLHGDHETALGWIDDAHRRSGRASDTWVVARAEILQAEAELGRAADLSTRSNRAARELVALSARAHLETHLEAGLALMGMRV